MRWRPADGECLGMMASGWQHWGHRSVGRSRVWIDAGPGGLVYRFVGAVVRAAALRALTAAIVTAIAAIAIVTSSA